MEIGIEGEGALTCLPEDDGKFQMQFTEFCSIYDGITFTYMISG